VSGVRISGITDATIGNSLIALTVTAIADCRMVAAEPSVVMTMICAGPAQTEMRAMREPADADIGREQQGGEDRGRYRLEALREGAKRAIPFRGIERRQRHGPHNGDQ